MPRAEFSSKIRYALAARVAFRCSSPGCRRITIGPGTETPEKVVIVGEACHIYAAAENGPRPKPAMTPEERSSIENGIWLCKTHARLIDRDTGNFSAQTLLLWKKQAEHSTYQRLMDLKKESDLDGQTLIALQNNLICSAKWLLVEDDNWVFEVDQFIEGSERKLINIALEFSRIPSWNKYIIIESQGDGRELSSLAWRKNANDKLEITCQVKPKSPRTDPHLLGGDIAIGDNFDFFFKDNDIAIVQGIDSAIQDIRIHLSTIPGDYTQSPLIGSHVAHYFERYGADLDLLNRLIKLEIIRLLTVVIPGNEIELPGPSFSYVNQVIDVSVLDIDKDRKKATVSLSLEWGNGELWNGQVVLGINTDRIPIDWDAEL